MRPIVGIAPGSKLFTKDKPIDDCSIIINYLITNAIVTGISRDVIQKYAKFDNYFESWCQQIPRSLKTEPSIMYCQEDDWEEGISSFLSSQKFHQAIRDFQSIDTSYSVNMVERVFKPFMLFADEIKVYDPYILESLGWKIKKAKGVAFLLEEIMKNYPGKLTLVCKEPTRTPEENKRNQPPYEPKTLIKKVLAWVEKIVKDKTNAITEVEIDVRPTEKRQLTPSGTKTIGFPHDRIVEFIYTPEFLSEKRAWYVNLGKGFEPWLKDTAPDAPICSVITQQSAANHLKSLNSEKRFEDSDWLTKFGLQRGANVFRK